MNGNVVNWRNHERQHLKRRYFEQTELWKWLIDMLSLYNQLTAIIKQQQSNKLATHKKTSPHLTDLRSVFYFGEILEVVRCTSLVSLEDGLDPRPQHHRRINHHIHIHLLWLHTNTMLSYICSGYTSTICLLTCNLAIHQQPYLVWQHINHRVHSHLL